MRISDAQFSVRSNAIVARLTGEIDLSNADAIGDAILVEVPNQSAALVLDLSAVDYIDSAGIRLVFQLRTKLRARGQGLALVVAPTSPAGDALRLAGVAGSVETVESLEQALDGVAESESADVGSAD